MKKLIMWCIIGIVVGLAASYFLGGDQNRYLTYGLVGGLLVGYLTGGKELNGNKTDNNGEKKSLTDGLSNMIKNESSEKASKTIDESNDLIAQARANIAGTSSPDTQASVSSSTDSVPSSTSSDTDKSTSEAQSELDATED